MFDKISCHLYRIQSDQNFVSSKMYGITYVFDVTSIIFVTQYHDYPVYT